ncbi:MAG: Si-specific NAD(P)(+) transhydrogenase [Rhodospirillaceae bacterium]|nr:Si-specific NAD(P)(+) transhydrogenase [Rhodospirillaceae bacterium]MBT5666548.1 Si-specific NAD(P)(+) transhydrogenase [Rhodospirillaceae bacterium]MBT5809369.1 Si-specific NAD(P)(+) transhydrogenase [Rhodospirillaceae bacterium]
MSEFDYDLVVMGSGPAGQRAAIQAAKLGKRTAVVEHKQVVGGACINTGTIPSKTLREAALHLSGYQERSIYGASYAVKSDITMADLFYRTEHVIANELDTTRHQLQRNGVELIAADASFVDPHTVRLKSLEGRGSRDVSTEYVVIAVGTETTKDSHIEFDGRRIFTSDDLLHLQELPKSMAVVGAGVIGLEYATIFAALGVRVTLIDKRPRLLTFVDAEIIDTLVYQMRQNRMTLRLGEGVSGVEKCVDERGAERVRIRLDSGKQILAGNTLYSVGRTGCTSTLGLDTVGIDVVDRDLISVDENYCTEVPNIYAVGDVIGFPSLASTSMEQGRHASCHAFGVDPGNSGTVLPYGIYTIPEISVIGKNEEELTEAGIPYEVGKASYKEISRGQIIGDSIGMLKLLFHMDTRELLGVAILGEGASELIHIGQAVLQLGGTIDYFVNTVFNYPTLAECYKTAAFDGINRMG